MPQILCYNLEIVGIKSVMSGVNNNDTAEDEVIQEWYNRLGIINRYGAVVLLALTIVRGEN